MRWLGRIVGALLTLGVMVGLVLVVVTLVRQLF